MGSTIDAQRESRPADVRLPRVEGQPGVPARPESAQESQRRQWAERLQRKIDQPGESRRELQERSRALPPGHPSSPWDEHGDPRPPVPRLADIELPEGPLSDAEYADHIAKVESALDKARANGLATELQFTINSDHDIWSDERSAVHDEIIDEAYAAAAAVPCDGLAIIAGGLGGAGKTTVLEQYAGIDRSSYLTINPDNFKEQLAERGLVPEVPGLSPMEASPLVHEESSYIARQVALRALADGKNIIWDITMSSPASAGRRIDELRTAGYQSVDGVFVDIPIETSVMRTEERHRRGHDLFLAGEGSGGRYLPADIIRAQSDAQYGSVNRRTFEMLKDRLDSWIVFDNSSDGHPPTIIGDSRRKSATSISQVKEEAMDRD